MPRKTQTKEKEKKNIPNGVVHIQSTFNNTIVTISDPAGNTVAWSSAGVQGFKGSRKSTPFAAQLAAQDAAKKAIEDANISVDEIDISNLNLSYNDLSIKAQNNRQELKSTKLQIEALEEKAVINFYERRRKLLIS